LSRDKTPSPPRVRFAPSPTGKLHIGGARTALFNWAYARRHGGVFLLRIEDTDTERNSQASLDSILASLRWLGLDWDEGPEKGGACGPYFQSERRASYDAATARGLEEGWLYRCFTPAAEIEAQREAARAAEKNWRYDERSRAQHPFEAARRAAAGEPFVVRVRVPDGQRVLIQDRVRGAVEFASEQVEDWVAVRSGGMPTYNYCCVLDDAAMRITHVIRGEEHLANTPKQVLLYQALGLPLPEFAHVPLILGQDGKKLSKRTGDTAVEDYRAKGYPPEALFNFLCLLGFSIDDKTTVFTPDEFLSHFDLDRLQKAGAVFDIEKLHWLCGEYLRRRGAADLAERALPWMQEAGLVAAQPDAAAHARLAEVAAVFLPRLHLYGDLPQQARFLYADPLEPDEPARPVLADPASAPVAALAADALERAPWPPSDFAGLLKEVAAAQGLKLGAVMKPVRAALTGSLGGPELADVLRLLGRERALARLRAPAPAAR
jgi:glutamyl-tRNA synthetase